MKTKSLGLIIVIGVILLLVGCGGCSYNSMNSLRQETNESWSNVDNQYKRRSDLIPNLVATVQGAANFERETLEAVVNARAKATSMQINPNDLTPEKMAEFQAAQGQLSQALGRLLVVVEKYPDLKANANFQNLQVELSNTENKIATERSRYNETVKKYNTQVTKFPNTLYAGILGFKERGYFQATTEERATPKVVFPSSRDTGTKK
jgi:LemA protein